MYQTAIAGTPARITAVRRGRFEVVCDDGACFARLKTGAYRTGDAGVPTVGDFVLLDRQDAGDGLIFATLPRKTYFSRLDPSSAGRGEQAVAANFEYAFLLQPLDRGLRARSLERYLTLAWQSGATPVVLLTKADCAADASAQLRATERLAIGAEVLAVSAVTGQGLDRLAAYLQPGRTAVCLGPSGAGKSSLINALAGETVMPAGETRAADGRGRHTTTHRQLLRLPGGAMVIDTPGMRELGMREADAGLEQSFADVEQYLGRCKFSDCRHRTEPGCAIREAIRQGALSQARWESYERLRTEARFADDKAGFLREKQRRFKEIAKLQRAAQTPDYRREPCAESFRCAVCGALVTPERAGSAHRNHCPQCLSSVHADNRPGDRASLCRGIMDPIGVWVRNGGEWAVIHRCRGCGALHTNRIAADDNATLLLSIAMRPLAAPPFPLWRQEAAQDDSGYGASSPSGSGPSPSKTSK